MKSVTGVRTSRQKRDSAAVAGTAKEPDHPEAQEAAGGSGREYEVAPSVERPPRRFRHRQLHSQRRPLRPRGRRPLRLAASLFRPHREQNVLLGDAPERGGSGKDLWPVLKTCYDRN